ncbi:MAG TPA: Xaa-Pro aminopeptidase [Thiotrichales bacterium]|nr:Xaa-Pro aminopeptidase [Thiotrichales bacterium]
MNSKEFARRRRQLMRMMGKGSIAVVPSARIQFRNRDAEFPFRQESDFLYLTGFPEPEAVAVLVPGRPQGQYILFCRERDPEKEVWSGRRAGQEGARERYGADDSFPMGDIDEILPGLLEGRERLYYTVGRDTEFDRRLIGWLNDIRARARGGSRTPGEIVELDHLLHDMRLFKSRAEIAAMRRAAKVSVEAHRRAMRFVRPGVHEYQVEAEILHTFHAAGMVPAYTSIVGGGPNACILHYVENRSPLEEGQLLLIDAGAEHDGYAADITRTFPVSGAFSKAQRALYEVVLEAQEAAIAQVRPGNHWNDPHEAAVRVITEGLIRLKLLKGEVEKLIEKEAYRRFYMHRTGHWLGMDVHDVGDYKVGEEWRVLEPGMVLTVEPGVYVPAGSRGVARKWWDIGIRIEDDVLVTADGCEVLTEGAPKGVEEIEAWMAGGV